MATRIGLPLRQAEKPVKVEKEKEVKKPVKKAEKKEEE